MTRGAEAHKNDIFLFFCGFLLLVGSCDLLFLDGRASTAFNGREIIYLFTAVSCSGRILSNNITSWSSNTGLVGPLDMDPNTICLISLEIENFMGIFSVPDERSVTKSPDPVPLVSTTAVVTLSRSLVRPGRRSENGLQPELNR